MVLTHVMVDDCMWNMAVLLLFPTSFEPVIPPGELEFHCMPMIVCEFCKYGIYITV
jgi:hypothetical protein